MTSPKLFFYNWVKKSVGRKKIKHAAKWIKKHVKHKESRKVAEVLHKGNRVRGEKPPVLTGDSSP